MRTLPVFASLSAPLPSSSVTADRWPFHAALCSGVAAFCGAAARLSQPYSSFFPDVS
jgi:hypothetical protein